MSPNAVSSERCRFEVGARRARRDRTRECDRSWSRSPARTSWTALKSAREGREVDAGDPSSRGKQISREGPLTSHRHPCSQLKPVEQSRVELKSNRIAKLGIKGGAAAGKLMKAWWADQTIQPTTTMEMKSRKDWRRWETGNWPATGKVGCERGEEFEVGGGGRRREGV